MNTRSSWLELATLLVVAGNILCFCKSLLDVVGLATNSTFEFVLVALYSDSPLSRILLYYIEVGGPHFVHGGRFKIQHFTNELRPNSNKRQFAQDVRILNGNNMLHLYMVWFTCTFQIYSNIKYRDELHPTYLQGVHYKWMVDIVAMPMRVGQKKFLVLAREDLTNQVDRRALRSKTTSPICQFILEDIVCRYGCVGKIVVDRGELNSDEAG